RNLPHFAFACELARTGKLGKLKKVYAHPAGMQALMSGWLPAQPEPDKEKVDWDIYLGPAAWRPFNERLLDGFNFEKGGDSSGPSTAAASSNGARTASTCASGPSETVRLPSNTILPKTAISSRAIRAASS